MNRNWAIFFAILAVLSIKEAFINGHVKHGETSAEDFSEFDSEEPAAHKYSQQANEAFDNDNNDEEVEIRDPSGYASPGKPFTVPLNSPPIKFSYW